MDDRPFISVTGKSQVTEPKSTEASTKSDQQTTPKPKLAHESSSSSLSTVKRTHSVKGINTNSAANLPRPSRESSPARPSLRSSSNSRVGRSRKNSSKDASPSRTSAPSNTNPPSAASIQRALSASNTPQLHPVSDTTIKAPVPQKALDTPRWPISPRLKSPPPAFKASVVSPRRLEPESPTTNAQRSGSVPTGEAKFTSNSDSETSLAVPGMRTPARGVSGASSTLETVQESSQPVTPCAESNDGDKAVKEEGPIQQMSERENPIDSAFNRNLKRTEASNTESGSDSGGKKNEGKIPSTTVPTPATMSTTPRQTSAPPMKPYSVVAAAAIGRGKPAAEGSTRNMTVETETVTSIPHLAVGGTGGGSGVNGSLRAKPSSETIRPRKEKKKTARKAPSVTSGMGETHSSTVHPKLHHHHHHHHHHSTRSIRDSHLVLSPKKSDIGGTGVGSGTMGPPLMQPLSSRPSLNFRNVGSRLTSSTRIASSKADIFEAKVASAVDEANSSDSDETFVYESNPPESNDRPRRYHHSRTPSATSMASQADPRGGGIRSVHGAMDGVHSVAMKKSMKFANSYNNPGPEAAVGEEDGKGTARSSNGTGRGTTHHHHIGRWGRHGGNGHPSLFDNESPFPNVAKSKLSGSGSRHSSRPTSPRVGNPKNGNGKKASLLSHYDIDDGAGADDERTPLMTSSVRSARSGRGRRPVSSSMRQLEHQAYRANKSFLARFAGCIVLTLMIALVLSGAVGFMFATTEPLTEVKVLALKNVLASEQEIMLDLLVRARNPNVVVVSVDSMDVNVFAKSKHVGTDGEWYHRPQNMFTSLSSKFRKRDDDPRDPIEDDPDASQTMLLGRIFEFDSPLTFDGSPFRHLHSTSMGEVRLAKPGNKTEAGGTERWERVLKYEFELILRGVLKYTLPLSQKVRSVGVEGRVFVKPSGEEEGGHDKDHVHSGFAWEEWNEEEVEGIVV